MKGILALAFLVAASLPATTIDFETEAANSGGFLTEHRSAGGDVASADGTVINRPFFNALTNGDPRGVGTPAVLPVAGPGLVGGLAFTASSRLAGGEAGQAGPEALVHVAHRALELGDHAGEDRGDCRGQ